MVKKTGMGGVFVLSYASPWREFTGEAASAKKVVYVTLFSETEVCREMDWHMYFGYPKKLNCLVW